MKKEHNNNMTLKAKANSVQFISWISKAAIIAVLSLTFLIAAISHPNSVSRPLESAIEMRWAVDSSWVKGGWK